MQKQDEELTEKEIRLGLNLERDLNDRWFAFLSEDLEHDKFEDLELRSNTSAGIGYFVIRQPDHEWKLRAGIGYEFSAYDNDINERRAVAVLGYDYRIDIAEWVRFTHKISYLPAFDDPTTNYRVNSDVGFEVPLASSELYAVRIGMRNEYNNAPPPGTKSLDTTYGADLVLKVP
jgi:putative salt-induced outer membrane protein YdiY